MRCPYCSCEITESDVRFCPQCGNALPQASEQAQPSNQGWLSVVKDPLFLAICVLMSVSCVLAFAAENIPVITVLFVIFLWIVYAQGYKDEVSASSLRCLSGTVFAEYVIGWVSVAALAVLGLAFMVSPAEMIAKYNLKSLGIPMLDNLVDALAIVGVILLVSAVAVALINWFGVRKIHRLAKSAYQNVENPAVPVVGARAVRNWLWVLGIVTIVGVLGSIGSVGFFADTCSGAAAILSALMVNKYLL